MSIGKTRMLENLDIGIEHGLIMKSSLYILIGLIDEKIDVHNLPTF